MSTSAFDATDHPRDPSGRFATKPATESATELPAAPDVSHLMTEGHGLEDWELELVGVSGQPVVVTTDVDEQVVSDALWYSSRVLWGPDAEPDPARLGHALVPVRQAIVFYGPDSDEAQMAARDFVTAETEVPGWTEQSPERESELVDDSARNLVTGLVEQVPARHTRQP